MGCFDALIIIKSVRAHVCVCVCSSTDAYAAMLVHEGLGYMGVCMRESVCTFGKGIRYH